MDPDPYGVLGVSSRASLDEAEDAYHRLLRQEHPDLHHTAGPERVARAEQRTRELNAAISAIRDARTVRTGTGPPPRDHRTDQTREQDRWAAYEAGDERGGEAEPPTAPCPWCGEQFAHAVDLKDHVFADHDLRLDRRVRPGLFGGRFHRWTRGAAHLPLWGLIPINLGVALLIGILAAQVAGEAVGVWAFAITMVPTIAVVIDRLFDAAG